MSGEQTNEVLVRRFYEELWNHWRLDLADDLVASEVVFRGSLGSTLHGRRAFKGYVEQVRIAFPDWHNSVDELLAVRNRVVARLTWSGTHRGPFQGIAATGRRVSYVGAGFFSVAAGQIAEAWVVGDTQELWKALGRL